MYGVQMVQHVSGAHSSLLLGSASDLVANFVDLILPKVLYFPALSLQNLRLFKFHRLYSTVECFNTWTMYMLNHCSTTYTPLFTILVRLYYTYTFC